jgi:hypothetical protein
MKKAIFTLAIVTSFFAGAILTGCQSSAQQAEAAEVKVLEAQQDLSKAEAKASEATIIMVNTEEWQTFKTESELKIRDNEIRIAELRFKMKKPGKVFDSFYAKRIDALEQKNKNLKIRMETYDKNQTNWESFRDEFKHDMKELGQAFKDLTVDNK